MDNTHLLGKLALANFTGFKLEESDAINILAEALVSQQKQINKLEKSIADLNEAVGKAFKNAGHDFSKFVQS